jgi:hypothetical protein
MMGYPRSRKAKATDGSVNQLTLSWPVLTDTAINPGTLWETLVPFFPRVRCAFEIGVVA